MVDKEDYTYWANLKEPKIPNEYEVSLFEKYAIGEVLLLGETKRLQQIADEGIDLFPTTFAKKGDWYKMNMFYDTIIGDGVLNINIGMELLNSVKWNCNRFICRVFGNEIKDKYSWKYANYFYDEFLKAEKVIKTQKGCYTVVWDFTTERINEQIEFENSVPTVQINW